MKDLKDLIEKIEKEEFVLFDSCIGGDSTFYKDIYNISRYNRLDSVMLEEEIERLSLFLDLIKLNNTYTVKEVLKELEQFQGIITIKHL